MLEVDINYIHRVPLWDVQRLDSHEFLAARASQVPVLDLHEIAAGKLAALLARQASRDLFDARQLLGTDQFDVERLRLAFVVYGGMNRVDWRHVSIEDVGTTGVEVRRHLLPMLRNDLRPETDTIERWTDHLVHETRDLLGVVLPLTERERTFLKRRNDDGVIEPSWLTSDSELQRRVGSHPGLHWKALNVRNHRR